MRALKLTAAGDIIELDIDLTRLDVVQQHVGGFVEQLPFFDDPATVLLVDEDGRPRRLPVNSLATRLVRYRRLGEPIVGDALVVGIRADGWSDCPPIDLDDDPWQVAVYHNTNRDAMAPWRGYRPGDPLTLVARYHTIAPSVRAVLDRAWFLFKVGDDPAFGPPAPVAVAYRERRNRSLSVGDVVAVTERSGFAVVSPTGFDHVDPLTVTNVRVDGTTPLDGAS